MADERNSRDVNFIPVIAGVTDDASTDITQIRVDPTSKRLKVTADATTIDGYTAVGTGTLYITAGGRVQQLNSGTACKRVYVQAAEGNSGTIVIGGSSVAATLVLRQGLALYPTQSAEFNVSNLNLLYATSITAGDAITWYYES